MSLKSPVLAILQNMWFHNVESARAMFDKRKGRDRRRLIARFLFGTSNRTGKKIRKFFGDELVEHIEWEEASLEIGGKSSSVYAYDMIHIRDVIDEVKPDIVITFGKVAQNGVWSVRAEGRYQVYNAPHPMARHSTVTEELIAAAEYIRKRVA